MKAVRTCVGCGQRDAKGAMVRLVRDEARIMIDVVQRAPGRGAYLHGRARCAEAFAKRRGPVRSLRWAPSASERVRVAGDVLGEPASVG